ncbi:MAG TPA: RdgB/HAM1 family non-canonical purine NTP pyrophosphatase [Gemmatirosa sp.]
MTDRARGRMAPRDVIVATRNAGKASELRELLAALPFRILSLDDAGIAPEPEEDDVENGTTFTENAVAKARYFAARAGGRAVIADDSGLCVDALGGAPGVRSRRYSGALGSEREVSRANCAHLLEALRGVDGRRAHFACAIAYSADGAEVVGVGRTNGRILDEARGAAGFGYDPLFWSDDLQRSFGEARAADKARVSHRARAVAQLVRALDADAPAPNDR